MSEQYTTGKAKFTVNNTTYYTWYKIYGNLKTSGKTPLLALHGGPGMSHDYMLPNREIFFRTGTPIIFYDQLGNGESSHIHDVPESFWTAELLMSELDNLLDHLGIAEDFYLLGHSWGGMLAGNWVATRQPKGLKRLIIANSPSSVKLVMIGQNDLLDKFPQKTQDMIRKHEDEGSFDAQEYKDGIMEFCKKHICDMDPWPKELIASFAAAENDSTVSKAMTGRATFLAGGTLKDWSIVDILHKICYPTLLLSAPLDEVQNIAVMPWFLNIPKIKWVEFTNSTHIAHFEEPERYFDVVLRFLE